MILLKKLCIFYLIAKLLLHLSPEESYEAYLSLLVEWSALALLLLSLGTRKDFWQKETDWKEQIERYFVQVDAFDGPIMEESVEQEVLFSIFEEEAKRLESEQTDMEVSKEWEGKTIVP